MAPATTERILDIVRDAGVLRPRDLEAVSIPGGYLARLAGRGLLTKVGRGLYTLPDAAASEHRLLAELAKRVPRGVICLLSALRYHGLTTQAPFEIWLAIGQKDRSPGAGGSGLRVVRFSGAAFDSGVETHIIDGVPVRMYSPAKTVADCFKYRNKLGLDVAIEALRDCVEQRRCTADELSMYARVSRVSRVMRPYMEAIM